MSSSEGGRLHFLNENPQATGWSALKDATAQQQHTTPGPVKINKDQFSGKKAVIIGSGVAGLTTAYELLAQESGMEVTILEAHDRSGGRCLSLRTGDTLTEDKDRKLFDAEPGETQMIRFARPTGDSEPYLNAGPGRIPSGHKRLLHYLKKFNVDLEVYVMDSGANLTQMADGPFHGHPVVNRRLNYNTLGWVGEMVYQNAEILLRSLDDNNGSDDNKELKEQAKNLQSLMVTLGNLNSEGKYVTSASPDGLDGGASDRAGFTELPGVHAGVVAEALSLSSLLESEFWKKTKVYQSYDFLWQPTLFQPVGGMDRVQHAFTQQIASLGGTLHLNSPVKTVDWDESKQKFIIHIEQVGSDVCKIIEADYCFSNVAMPFLKNILSPRLQGEKGGFDSAFKNGLASVYKAQFEPTKEQQEKGYDELFLACTTKVGWQADRSLWQGSGIQNEYNTDIAQDTLKIPDTESGVVPIFGGISWTDNPITQIWYPSTAYHDELGVLTGCYNFSSNAYSMGTKDVDERLVLAREGASVFGEAFGKGLDKGVAIAWQNMPYVKGGWAQWHVVKNSTEHFNQLIQGTGIDGSDPKFFIVGDQLSSLPGWQEGAVASALNALTRLCRCDLHIPHLASLSDTRVIVEGV